MGNGWLRGRDEVREMGVSMFVNDEGGYTSVATALSLLVSVSLVFTVASVQWTISRAADVQPTADACAMAGQNTVASYYTIAQVLDASILSMGIAGMTMMGAGLVAAAVPGAQGVSAQAISMGTKILHARQRFARSAASGLQKIERILPAIVVANSASCVAANNKEGLAYTGVAIPFPQDSHSRFSVLDAPVDADEVSAQAERLRDATARMEDVKNRVNELRREGWHADCMDDPSCLCSRASSLGGLSDWQNPRAMTPEEWNFGMPILRSREYYAARLMLEAPEAADIESIADSLCRSAFYEYALDEVNGAWYSEDADGRVDMHLPHLARNAQEVRETWLYDDPRWPCTDEDGNLTLHADLSCPAATGVVAGTAGVSAIERGEVRECGVCRMGVGDLGKVAAISTSATSGYEHYWQTLVELAPQYEQAKNELADAEELLRGVAEDGDRSFSNALSQLGTPRPYICPPGAWGCVAIVSRARGTSVPSELTRAFLTQSDLPAGVAVSGAALAPDDATNGNDVLSHFFDSVGGNDVGGSALSGLAGMWGRVLVSYGNKYRGMEGAINDFFGGMNGLFGGTVGSWLKNRVCDALGALGLEPADMRMRKPVLTSTQNVLGKAGIEPSGRIRSLVQSMPDQGTPLQIAHALGYWIWDERTRGEPVVIDMPIPGADTTVPLTIDLGSTS